MGDFAFQTMSTQNNCGKNICVIYNSKQNKQMFIKFL